MGCCQSSEKQQAAIAKHNYNHRLKEQQKSEERKAAREEEQRRKRDRENIGLQVFSEDRPVGEQKGVSGPAASAEENEDMIEPVEAESSQRRENVITKSSTWSDLLKEGPSGGQ